MASVLHICILGIAILLGLGFRYNAGRRSTLVSETLQSEYDYIIVGAGAAGAVLAARLAEDKNTSVLLLEAGGHFDENPFIQVPMVWALLQGSDVDWGYYTESQTDVFKAMVNQQSYWPRGRVVGGSSAINAMHYTRGSPFDFDEWSKKGCKGWDYKSVLPYFMKSEDMLINELQSSPFHSQGGPLAVSHNPPAAITSVFLKAGQELGYDITDYNGADQEGFNVVQSNVRNGVRSSAALELLGTSKRLNLDIGIRSFVTKVEIRNNSATGVYYIRNGRKHFVRSRNEVIVSAGTINSPQLLMLSGVGPKAHLTELGISVEKDLPVGQYLKDHQMVYLLMRSNVSLGRTVSDIMNPMNGLLYQFFGSGPLVETGPYASAFLHLDKTKRGKTYPDIQFILYNILYERDVFGLKPEFAHLLLENDTSRSGFTSNICLTRPKSVGNIRLRSNDPFDHPVINPGYYSNKEDVATIIGGIRIWERIMETQAMREIGAEINQLKNDMCSENEFRSDEYWECYIRHISTTEYHPTSTCRMGTDGDPLAVVDVELKVRGVNNLRVVDASVFPDVVSGNTHAATVMVAEKAADMIRGIDSVGDFRKRIPA